MRYRHGHSADMDSTYCNFKFDHGNFVSLLDDFRQKELYCDATIACNGRKFSVHQVVLSACSDFFAGVFASTSCQNPLVVLQDTNSAHLECLLTYIYKGEVQVPHTVLPDFIKMARALFIKGLMIPQLEKPVQSESISGTWHEASETYQLGDQVLDKQRGPNFCMDYPEGHNRPRTTLVSRTVIANHSPSHIQLPTPGDTPEDHFRRYNGSDQRTPTSDTYRFVSEHSQDLSANHELNIRSFNGSGRDTSKESHCKTDSNSPEVQPEDKNLQKSAAVGHQDGKVSQMSKFSVSESHSTFQDLVVDECIIKREPEDLPMDCDSKDDLTPIIDDAGDDYDDDDEDDDDETRLHISEDQDDMVPDDSTLDQSCGKLELKTEPGFNPQIPTDLVRTQRDSTSPQGSISPGPQLSPNSHLRRELLRPVPVTVGPMKQQQQSQIIPQSIPHPVIAVREPHKQHKSPPLLASQPTLREPPPLMKIPNLIEDREDLPANRGCNTHLLVKAPPTYRTHSAMPNQFCFEIQNRQLGPVIVNGGPHIAIAPPSIPSRPNHQNDNVNWNYLYNNDIPLNLSGVQRSPSKSPENTAMEDPFLGKIVTNRKKRLRGPKSWEFLVRLLKDPTTNPSLIRWENEQSCVFRLVQPSVIAQRWGRRTGKHASENLTYENFARGLRYHYATGALKPVSEKSFVYRFGPKAIKLLQECDSSSFPYI